MAAMPAMASSAALDSSAYPTLIDRIIALAPYPALLALRGTNHAIRDLVDAHLLLHVGVTSRMVTVKNRRIERIFTTNANGHRIPRQDWWDTPLIQHLKYLDLRGRNAGQGPPWAHKITHVPMLRDQTTGMGYAAWPRPQADLHILVAAPYPGPHGSVVVVPDVRAPYWAPTAFRPKSFTVVLLPPPPGFRPVTNRKYYAYFESMAQTVAELLAPRGEGLVAPVTLVNFEEWYPLQWAPATGLFGNGTAVPPTFVDHEGFKAAIRRMSVGSEADDWVEDVVFLSLEEYRARVGEKVFSLVETAVDR